MVEDEPVTIDSTQPITPEEVDLEIAEGIKSERGNFGLLNNFALRLPGGAYRVNFTKADMLNDTYAPTPEEYEESRKSGVSEKRMKQTHSSFFAEIDKAIQDSGVDPNHLEELRQVYLSKTGQEAWLAKEEYLHYSIPVYRQLRLMGYTHADLTL